jgi:hypothetical protein
MRLQQQQIAARLEHLAHPAHIISFPPRVARHMTATSSRVAPRWIAAAAAAGLFIGVAVGRFLDLGTPADRFERMRIPAVATAHALPPSITGVDAPGAAIGPAPVADGQIADDEDVFLSELELALERPRTYELRPFDAFTPRVHDAVNRLR